MRRILQASAVMGVSSVVTVLASAGRYKLLALHLGAEGIGLLGVLMTALALGVTVFSMGIGSSGIRQVAASRDDPSGPATRAALMQGSRSLGLLALGLGLLLLPLAGLVGRSDMLAGMPPSLLIWLIVGVAASVASSGPLALLNGMGQLSELAKSNILGALMGTGVTVLALYASPQSALAAAVVGVPLFTLLFSSWYARTSQERPGPRLDRHTVWKTFRPILIFGLAFSGSLLLSNLVQLLTRLLVGRHLGLAATGYYQAAWTVANVYLGFVITAMAAEFYPRISAIAREHTQLNAQVNAQAGIILTIGVPAVLAMMATSPLLLLVLYSSDFLQAVPLLRWQLFGDILKLVGWSLGFLLLAKEAKRAFFFTELVWNGIFLLLALPLLEVFGLKGLGAAYVCAYAAYLGAALYFARRISGYVMDRRVWLGGSIALLSGVLMEVVSAQPASILTGLMQALIVALFFIFSVTLFGFRVPLLSKLGRRRA